MAIIEGITAVKASLEVAKLLGDRLSRPDIDVVDVRAKLHEMLIHLANAQIALTEAHLEIQDLRGRIQEGENIKAIEADLNFVEDVYWKANGQTVIDGPYCPTCWDDNRKLIRLKFENEGNYELHGSNRKQYMCSLHKLRFFLRAERCPPLQTSQH